MSRMFVGLGLGLVFLAGCTVPEPRKLQLTSSGLKPGITAAQFDTRQSVPNKYHVTYDYKSSVPEESGLYEFTYSPREGGHRIAGFVLVAPPDDIDPQDLQNMAVQMQATEFLKDGKIKLPFNVELDERFQGLNVSGITKVRYEPHDCSSTLGECKFTRIKGNKRERRVSVLSETGGIWHRIETVVRPMAGEDELEVETYFTLDKYGIVQDSKIWRRTKSGEELNTAMRLK
ncbi:hypothetical protein GCM10008927_24360 [Amylibacter ulvae]|uniref:Lipoprotein n=1 Tax=Paramylibacter ulvae TaxID=1651968 RepID=A0ABQ3D428_9RHOB|nr:hypothetical protein [Amylibacter ulvae]GHA57706.1 hypothetical protein GCM10008927_24360 [Amylibacter ulvae]